MFVCRGRLPDIGGNEHSRCLPKLHIGHGLSSQALVEHPKRELIVGKPNKFNRGIESSGIAEI